jgi:hypothetical protein
MIFSVARLFSILMVSAEPPLPTPLTSFLADLFAVAVKEIVLYHPVDVSRQVIHLVVDVQQVVDHATRKKHVIDHLLHVVEDGYLEDSKAFF